MGEAAAQGAGKNKDFRVGFIPAELTGKEQNLKIHGIGCAYHAGNDSDSIFSHTPAEGIVFRYGYPLGETPQDWFSFAQDDPP